jgi:hypothetical protein
VTRWVYIDAVDHTDKVRLESMSLVEAAYGCDVGQGGFNRDDAALFLVPAMKPVQVLETDASPTRMFTGYVGTRDLDRGPLPKVQLQRQFDVSVYDINTLWDDPVLEGADSKRPEETDYERMTWLIGTDEFAALGIAAGVVPNTNTVTLDARDYRGEHPRLVAEECMETSSKNCFLYDFGAGPLVYYDLATGTSLSSSAKISSVLADVDEAGGVFAAAIPKVTINPDRVYSKVRFEYSGGHVSVTNATTETNFRARAVTIRDDTVKSATKATSKANKYLARSSTELNRFTVAVSVPAANVNDIRAGQRIPVKVPHLEVPNLDFSDYVWMRISRRTVLAQHGTGGVVWDRYTLVLEFADNLQPAGFGGRTGDGTEPTVTDGAAATLTRYQLGYETGGGPFGPYAGLYEVFGSDLNEWGGIAGINNGKVSRTPERNVAWEFTDCGIGTGAVAGLETREVWHRFTVDLSDASLVGVRFTILPFIATGSGYTLSPGGMLIGGASVRCGIHTGASSTGTEVVEAGQFTDVGRIGDQGGEVFVPRSLLIDVADGYNWFVLAPGWEVSADLLICNSASWKPWGYGETGNDSGGTSIVSAMTQVVTGSGLSPWLPATGDVDGSNKTFGLPLWNGSGVPEVRVGAVLLDAGEYTYDAGALTVTLAAAPSDYMDGQVEYRAEMG